MEELSEDMFPINLKLIDQYQQKYPILMATYKNSKYKIGSSHGGSDISINLIMYEYNIVIFLILKSYVLNWYHKYLLHPGMDKTEAMILQHLYLAVIRNDAQKKVKNCDTCQRIKWSNKNMVDYQLRNLIKYRGENMFVSNGSPCHTNKGKEIKFKSYICYYDKFCYNMVQNNAI